MADVSKVKLNGTAYNIKDASVPSWAKQSSKPSYTQDEVGDGSTYKRVTSTEKSTWNNKGTYSKPSGGIPKSDLASAVQTSLGKADTALQSFTESDPTVPSWAKQSSKPSYTASEVGAIATSAKGAANGVASLDSAGKVPSSQLPSYVDDVLEYSAKSSFPSTGETGKIYVDTSTNKTYRWSGSAYVEISASLALGETSSTAYYGDKGKTAYTHSQTTSGNPHNVTKSDVGLGNVGNFKAVSTVASQGLSSTEQANARANIGAGTGNGTYSKPSGGIPKSDLASAVQTSLGKADSALQSHQTIKQDGVTGATVNRFGTCSIAAGTAAKTVSITTGTFTLEAGARVTVKFSNANTASSPTLNVNSTGAKNIFHKGAQITTGNNKGLLAGTVDFIYDGTQYHLIGNYIDTNTTYSSKSAASGGTDVSLCTTGEKYIWNNKGNGTVTSVKVGSTSYNPSSGVVSLPAYPTTLPASDVYSWAKQSSKPSYTASEVGLGNVGNFKAVSTVANQGLSSTEKSNARTNIGAGTSSFSGSYNDLSNKPTIDSVLNGGSTNAVQNKIVTQAITQTIDNGFKNLCPYKSLSMSGSGWDGIVILYDNLPAGEYAIQFVYTSTSTSQVSVAYSDGTSTALTPTLPAGTSSTIALRINATKPIKSISIYHNAAITLDNILICKWEDYSISTYYSPGRVDTNVLLPIVYPEYVKPTKHSNIASIDSGGYVQIGKLVIVNMRFTVGTACGQYTDLFTDLPLPLTPLSGGSACVACSSNNNTIMICANGRMQNYDSGSLSTGVCVVSAVYMGQ